MPRTSSPLITIENEITGQLQRLAIDIAGGTEPGRVLWQAAEWGNAHPLMHVYEPIAAPLLMARDALMSEWLARSRSDSSVAPDLWKTPSPITGDASPVDLEPDDDAYPVDMDRAETGPEAST